jgi:quercetin dioxygenase-like cupin family protein
MTSPDTTALDDALRAEFERNAFNPCVGSILLSENERARVWYIRLEPGERIGFHRHVLDYFWTALSAGRARSHINGGPPKDAEYFAGQTSHMRFGPGEFMLHDLHNIGETPLVFVTVEHLDSANPPLPLPADVRPRGIDPR